MNFHFKKGTGDRGFGQKSGDYFFTRFSERKDRFNQTGQTSVEQGMQDVFEIPQEENAQDKIFPGSGVESLE